MHRTSRALIALTLVFLGWAAWLTLTPNPRDAAALRKASSGPVREERLFVQRGIPGSAEEAVIVRAGAGPRLPSAEVRILKRSAAGAWTTVLADTIEECEDLLEKARLEDLSGDGIPELLVPVWFGSAGVGYACWHRDAEGRWTRVSDALANPSWCPRRQCVLEWSRGGAGNFDATLWAWEGDRLRAIEQVSQQELFFQRRPGYRLRVSRLKEGALATVREWESPTPHAWAVPEGAGGEPPAEGGAQTLGFILTII